MSDEKQAPPAQKPKKAKPRVWEIDRGRETPAQIEMINYHKDQNALRRAGQHVPSVLDMKIMNSAKRKPPGAI